MLRYENFEFLYLLLLIPIMLCLLIIYNKWKKNAVNKFSDKEIFKKIVKSYSKKRSKTKNILTFFIFIFLIIGIANPQIGTKMEEVKREGVDLMIAIDLSNSMLSEDIKPNRLERAKTMQDETDKALRLLAQFAGDPFLLLPEHKPLHQPLLGLKVYVPEESPMFKEYERDDLVEKITSLGGTLQETFEGVDAVFIDHNELLDEADRVGLGVLSPFDLKSWLR